MAKRNLLLVDADPRSVRVLEVSLRKAGYSVTTSNSVDDALELVELTEPDMVVSDTQLDGKDGFEFIQGLKAHPQLCKIPFVFLSSDGAVESKVRGLELGADEYLTKPVYIREILTRIHLIFQRQEQEGALRTSKTRFAGSLADMGLVDLLQTIDVSRKSGVLHLTSGKRRGAIYFMDGRLVDAELGQITGESAVYRFLVWNEGEFEVDFRDVRREDRIQVTTQGILMEGMRRLDEWGRLQEQLPAMNTVFQVNHDELLQRLAEIPDEINEVFRLFDGSRTLTDVVDASLEDDLDTLSAISKLYFEGFIVPGEPAPADEDDDGDVLVGAAAEDAGIDENTMLEPRDSLPAREPEAPPEGESSGPRPQQEPSEAADGQAPSTPGEVPRGSQEPGPSPEPAERSGPDGADEATDTAEPAQPQVPAAGAPRPPREASDSGDTDRGLAPVQERAIEAKTEAVASDTSSDRRPHEHSAEQETQPLRPPEAPPSHDARESSADPSAREPESEQANESQGDSNVIRFPSTSARGAAEGPVSAGSGAAAALATSAQEPSEGSEPHSADAEHEPAGSTSASGVGSVSGESSLPSAVSTEQAPGAQGAPPEPSFDDEPQDRFLRAESAPDDHDAVETFFSTPPPRPQYHDTFADLDDADSRRARARSEAHWLGISITVGVFLLLGAFLFYYRASLSTPDTGGPARVSLPTPDLMEGIDDAPSVEGQAPSGTAAEQAAPVVEAPPETAPSEQAAPPTEAAQAAEPEATEADEAAAPAGPSSDTVEEAYAGLVREARKMGFRKDAEKVYLRALALKPEGDEALSGLGMLLLNRGKNELALKRAAQAVAINPENSEGWIVLGAAHDALGHDADARKAYRQCVERGQGKYVLECRRMLR